MAKVSVFFPLRAGSTRILRKNTRPFRPDGRSLFQHKLEQLMQVAELVDEIVVSTNDQEVFDQMPADLKGGKLKIVRRPDALGSSTTKVRDLIDYVPGIVSGDYIFWVHATSPFIDDSDYRSALELLQSEVISGPKDSVMSVNKIQQFIWDDSVKKIINTDRSVNPWPNTQDLAPLYEINHAFYINSRKNYVEIGDRIGRDPVLFCCEGLKKIDVDWPEDFALAQAMISGENVNA
ncbi:cytidylyltransferase domain-containing protein [Plastorhodobacter daqingensis]|uniref:Cytidylyltransferase domain-containing protein n=1 Tax=Plastorhodobacter daqingensis TaxID=1387281 RepID=A0ABW2UPI8_9RHOB